MLRLTCLGVSRLAPLSDQLPPIFLGSQTAAQRWNERARLRNAPMGLAASGAFDTGVTDNSRGQRTPPSAPSHSLFRELRSFYRARKFQ